MTSHSTRRAPLESWDADPAGIIFHTDGPDTYADEHRLDVALIQCVRYGTGYINDNALDESDISELHNLIMQARERYDLENDCRGCRNEPAVEGDEYGHDCLRSLDRRDDEARDWDDAG